MMKKLVLVFLLFALFAIPAAASDTADDFLAFTTSRNNRYREFYCDEKFDPYEYIRSYGNIDCENSKLSGLTQRITEGMTSDYEKATAFYRWITSNLYYDMDFARKESEDDIVFVGDILDKQYCVCEGMAALFASMCRSVGIPCVKIYGYASASPTEAAMKLYMKTPLVTNHVWNEVFLDGKWITADATWDCRNYFSDGKYVKQNSTFDWFNVGTDEFYRTHFISIYKEPVRYFGFEFSFNGEKAEIGKYYSKAEIANLPEDMGISSIPRTVFAGSENVREITLPSTVTEIADRAFENCKNLTGIKLPGSIADIGAGVFKGCSSLKSISFPGSCRILKGSMFAGCSSLRYVNIGEGVTKICNNFIEDCGNLRYVVMPSTVTSLQKDAFKGSDIEDLYWLGDYSSFFDLTDGNRICKNLFCGKGYLPFEIYAESLKETHDFTYTDVPATSAKCGYRHYSCASCGKEYDDCSCSCICHRKGPEHIIYRAVVIFQRIAGKSSVCKCGAKHSPA